MDNLKGFSEKCFSGVMHFDFIATDSVKIAAYPHKLPQNPQNICPLKLLLFRTQKELAKSGNYDI